MICKLTQEALARWGDGVIYRRPEPARPILCLIPTPVRGIWGSHQPVPASVKKSCPDLVKLQNKCGGKHLMLCVVSA